MPQSEKLFIRVSNMFISKFQNFKDVEIAKSVFILNTMQTKERDLKLDARIFVKTAFYNKSLANTFFSFFTDC